VELLAVNRPIRVRILDTPRGVQALTRNTAVVQGVETVTTSRISTACTPSKNKGVEMEPTTHTVLPHTIKELRWPEASPDDLVRLVGSQNVNVLDNGVQVKNGDGEWVTLQNGWHVTLMSTGHPIIMSPYSLKTQYGEK
jgi:hypothetical protein